MRSNARECKGCNKWVHHRCHIANKGIGWEEGPEKSDYRCANCVKNIAGVFDRMVTKGGRRLRRRGSSGVTQDKVTATEARKSIKRKGVEKETEEIEGESVGDTNKNKKQKHTRETYTEEEVEEIKQMWMEENIEKIDDMGDDSDILEN